MLIITIIDNGSLKPASISDIREQRIRFQKELVENGISLKLSKKEIKVG